MKTIFTMMLSVVLLISAFAQEAMQTRMLGLSEEAPAFTAKSTMGDINFPDDYFGKWKIIFSHPADFTPVCTTELLELAAMQEELAKRNTAILVLSTDGLNSHIEWVKSMEEMSYLDYGKMKIKFPIIADIGYDISRKYGMIHIKSNSTRDVRSVFIINPDNKVSSVFIYPMEVGRNLNEILRTLDALQKVENKDLLTPANWHPGDDYLLKSPQTYQEAEKLALKNQKGVYSLDWYVWFKKDQ